MFVRLTVFTRRRSEDDTETCCSTSTPMSASTAAPASPPVPVTAIFAEDDVPDNMKAYIEINALWFKDKPAARAKVTEAHG